MEFENLDEFGETQECSIELITATRTFNMHDIHC